MGANGGHIAGWSASQEGDGSFLVIITQFGAGLVRHSDVVNVGQSLRWKMLLMAEEEKRVETRCVKFETARDREER